LQQVEALRGALDSWLVGLTFVRQRLLDVLAAEGVRPMDAEGQPFDPRLHVALEVVPAGDELPPGTVAAELRRGYLVGDRVLRHAEVAVSGPAPASAE
jgi:molecular chaperone GrpE